jgi:predicted esterase
MAMTRVTLAVNRTAHCAILGDLDQAPVEVWYVCHGYGQLAHRFLARFKSIEVPGRWIVAPEGLSRYYVRGSGGHVGASWMTREDRDQEILDYLSYLDSLHHHLTEGGDKAPERVVLLGFSQGCATVTRWAARGSIRPDRLILWGEVQAHDLTDEDYQRLRERPGRIELVAGREDPVVPAEAIDRAAAVLKAQGLEVEVMTFAGGHDIDSATLGLIAEYTDD